MASAQSRVEVAVVGGGVAGAALAAVLARRGRSVALIDPRACAAPEFRAEKLTGAQVATLRRLDLAAGVLAAATPLERLRVARRGRVVEERRSDEWGLNSSALVDALRAAGPAPLVARAARIAADDDGAVVTLADGSTVAARLAVLATGLGKAMLADLGIRRVEVARDHSLAVGFDLVPAPGAPPAVPLTWFGERPADRIAYLTLFPIGDRLRANLFTFHERDDPWVARFREDPRDGLAGSMPGLAQWLPPLAGATPPVVRPIHLHSSAGYQRPGVVLIGDAFANTCPTGGTGLAKALNDVERLAALVPCWLATPGLGADKVAAFYADPCKLAVDAEARARVRHARALALDGSPYWTLRRNAAFYAQRLRSGVFAARGLTLPGMLPEPLGRN